MADKILCVSLVVVAFTWMLRAVVRAITEYPNWYGVLLAFCAIVPGCFIIASVVRDRL